MDGIKYAVFTEKSIRLLGNNINILRMSNQDLIGRK
uniref:Ribosomal protein L23 n=1 Tax=Illigera rhodantha TaxID=651344 RepID=A0A8K1YWS5_9MAGN|nr:ribosomal protein L23 [Illigera rhodantha]